MREREKGYIIIYMDRLYHTIAPICGADSDTLILGTFPSPKSREQGFYYGHPQNRFWRVIAAVYGMETPVDTEGKKRLITSNALALWDVVASCEIAGAADATIRRETPNDIAGLIAETNIRRVFTNGSKARELYDRYIKKSVALEVTTLPSTSPANASYSLAALIDIWGRALRTP